MKKLDKILETVYCLQIKGDTGTCIFNIEPDSRKVVPGSLFVAIQGTISDGHDFIEKAISSGATAVVCERLPEKTLTNVTYVKVKDSGRALGLMASSYYDHPSYKLRLTGVTGTNGKTTTVTLLHDLFCKLGYRSGLISTVKYCIHNRKLPATHTTPDPVTLNRLLSLMVEDGCKYCFMEVSSHAIVQHRIAGLHFAGGIFTNISHDHLDYHKTFSEYLGVKKQFFDHLDDNSFALINKDDRNALYMVQNTKAKVKTYSLKSIADFKCKIIERDFSGMLIRLNGKELWTSLIGDFSAYNILAVFAGGKLLGAPEDEVIRIISLLNSVEGRFETLRLEGQVTAIVDYAHTPDALENILLALNQLKGADKQLITVAGAGGDRDRQKRPVMGRIAAEKSDRLILTSDNPRSEDPGLIIKDMLNGIEEDLRSKVICIISREEAIRTACIMARPGDFVLISGKGHETYQEIKGVRHHFDDREVVKSVLSSM